MHDKEKKSMEKKNANTDTGISYTLNGDYYLPNLVLPDANHRPIVIYGKQHRDYLKKNRRIVYSELLTSGRLHSYLADIDKQVRERLELLSKQIARQEGITETLKAENQLLWVQKMNNIRNRAMEIINREIIYR
jgi:hypothetical protein